MKSFEERLYNNRIYTYALDNMSYDMLNELRDQFGDDDIDFEAYTSGKYFTIKIDDSEMDNSVINYQNSPEFNSDNIKFYIIFLKMKVIMKISNMK